MVSHLHRILLAMLGASLFAGCNKAGTPYIWNLPQGFPPPLIPADNPLTVEKVELGRRLFHDTRLSANATQSCATCHRQSHGFAQPEATAMGSTGEQHHRNTMGLTNVAYAATLTWAHPSLTTIEDQMLIPLFGERPVEMGTAGHEKRVLAQLKADERYRRLFARAFPQTDEPVTFDNAVKAIASFVRTMTSFDSPFDRYAYGGDDAALTAAQLRGLDLFMSERLECSHCHSGFNFSQFVTHEANTVSEPPFHVTGLQHTTDAAPGVDRGLFDVTGAADDQDRFKAPTLRNVERSAPYMHDGSLATLEDVIDFYAAGGRELTGDLRGDGRQHPRKSPFIRGFALTAEEKSDVVAFLRSLTDEGFLTDPRFAAPPNPPVP